MDKVDKQIAKLEKIQESMYRDTEWMAKESKKLQSNNFQLAKDWACGCGFRNWGKREQCLKCDKDRPADFPPLAAGA